MRKFIQYFCSAMVLFVAALLAAVTQMTSVPSDVSIRLDDAKNSLFSPKQLSQEQIQNYHRDGALLVKGLLPVDQALALRETSESSTSSRKTVFDFSPKTHYDKIGFDLWRTNEIVASLSLTALPKIASGIMADYNKDTNGHSFRLLRDAFFNYASGGKGCGWHVDDEFFWPTQNDTSGLTVWIVLDEINLSEGGGLAVANMTRAKEIGNAPESPVSVAFCLQEIKTKGTCNMETKSPLCHDLFEQAKLEWDMKPGDAILWDRWTFHRGVAATIDNIEKKRYSVRYIPHNARAFGSVHSTVEEGSPFNSPYYPQVWPNLVDGEQRALENGLDGDMGTKQFLYIMGMILKRTFLQKIGIEQK